jgi:thiamine phosphate synthase YjbQ (UPF0047 family)
MASSTRLAVIDVSKRIFERHGDLLAPFRKLLYCSYHTTAGYLEQSLCARMHHRRESVEALVHSAQKLFPAGAPYRHDQMHLRTELTEEQKRVEPQNADSHLAFISLGLENCVTYDNRPDTPVYFIDLDGVYRGTRRRRQTTVVGFNEAEAVVEQQLYVPMSNHAIDSINLTDPRLGILEQLNDLLAQYEVHKGTIILSLEPSEQHAGLTVNEYETLLMKHDLAEVLRNPLWFMAQKATHMLRDPKAIRSKAKNYMKYDLVQLVNEIIDALGLNESLVERVIDRIAAASASRRLRMKRSVTLLVNNADDESPGAAVLGAYQSPILVQWQKNETQARCVNVRLVRFE